MRTITIEALKQAFQHAADYGSALDNSGYEEEAAYHFLLGYLHGKTGERLPEVNKNNKER